jgi:hypothetical protein
MSKPIGILLDPDTAHVLVHQGGADVVRDVAWDVDTPEAMVEALRAFVGSPSAIVVIIGLGFLEIAEPELPPLPASERQALLWRDADRYFPLVEPVAVACANGVALAMPAKRLDTWIRALRALAPVRAVISSPQVVARVLGTGAAGVAARTGEIGVVKAEHGLVRSVRRTTTPRHGPTAAVEAVKAISIKDVLLGATTWIEAPPSEQLLDPALSRTMRRDGQRRWATSATLAVGAFALLLVATDHARKSELATLQQRIETLSERSQPAVRAETRRSRAQAELALLANTASGASAAA